MFSEASSQPFGRASVRVAGLVSGLIDGPGSAVYDQQAFGSNNPSGVYADLVTALGFKPSVEAEKPPGGFDSLPLPFFCVERKPGVPAA